MLLAFYDTLLCAYFTELLKILKVTAVLFETDFKLSAPPPEKKKKRKTTIDCVQL
jgi:hypothetical protein